jgi:hypothetical protein
MKCVVVQKTAQSYEKEIEMKVTNSGYVERIF